MYYLAAAFYFLVEPPPGGFDLVQLLTSLTFTNTWTPYLTPTVESQWIVVPGGWSIGVEFTFYFLFPLMVTLVRSARAGAIFLLLAIALGCVANTIGYNHWLPLYGLMPTRNFIYFWFPNQLPIFAVGTLLFFAIQRLRNSDGQLVQFFQRWSLVICAACAAWYIVLAEKPAMTAFFFTLQPFSPLPCLLLMSAALVIFAVTLSLNPSSILINRPICALGKVSFSAYLLHFFVLHRLVKIPYLFDANRTGYAVIASFVALWCIAVPLTFLLSKLTFRFIETPGIEFGKGRPAAKIMTDIETQSV